MCVCVCVSGSVPDLGRKESRIPVLLVQNPGFQSSSFHRYTQQQQAVCSAGLDFGSGWELILPTGWSMAFWIALVYRGAKAVGLREQRSLAFEAGRLAFPDCCPDTPAGAKMSLSKADELRSAYNRRPPAKRCNYDKMGVVAPFHCPCLELVQGWMHSCRDSSDHDVDDRSFYCVRNQKLLSSLNDACAGRNLQLKSCKPNSLDESATTSVLTELLHCGCAVVKVRVVLLGRGSPTKFALICLPAKEDILDTADVRNRGRVKGPTEPRHRKSSDTKTVDLNPSTVLGSTVRPTIGFVVEGGFSHATAKGCGVGFVSALGLRKLLEQKPPAASYTAVLVRCSHSLQYRHAALQVVL